jgi:hypothetical protein
MTCDLCAPMRVRVITVVLSGKWNNACHRKHVHNGGFFLLLKQR